MQVMSGTMLNAKLSTALSTVQKGKYKAQQDAQKEEL